PSAASLLVCSYYPVALRRSLHQLLFFLPPRPPPSSTLFPYTTLFRSGALQHLPAAHAVVGGLVGLDVRHGAALKAPGVVDEQLGDRKSTRLNSSHVSISYAVFCLKKKRFVAGAAGICSPVLLINLLVG